MMVRNASNQRGQNSVTVALSTRNPWMLVASKAVFLGNYLAVSTWILNGSLIECHEKKKRKVLCFARIGKSLARCLFLKAGFH